MIINWSRPYAVASAGLEVDQWTCPNNLGQRTGETNLNKLQAMPFPMKLLEKARVQCTRLCFEPEPEMRQGTYRQPGTLHRSLLLYRIIDSLSLTRAYEAWIMIWWEKWFAWLIYGKQPSCGSFVISVLHSNNLGWDWAIVNTMMDRHKSHERHSMPNS